MKQQTGCMKLFEWVAWKSINFKNISELLNLEKDSRDIVGGLDICERWILNLKPKELGQNWVSKSTIRKYIH